ncbi:glycoside hydrolase family 3 protein [Allokutzneria sp. A3M-2-11 16]|uniref:glycoside hydrolase family 3 protein n=1 Tax=Allokutzneria sp. A3M-2-11 16 TaxID=2962043 RepID=UPI0020B83BBC|nr:glycoside hydrolase family 3 N-terminal domain-containing protein [Allokutzneria sp. A3M-2-11 16]MCP3800030.1 glycoside hydrolase family 3 protein [Allokutzneria sp. A3M-2-11 16]
MELRRLVDSVLLPGFLGTTPPDWVLRRVSEGLGGVVLFARNVVDDSQVAALTAALRAERPDVVVGIDEEGGDVTRLDAATGSLVPGSLALGVADDVAMTSAVAASLGARLAEYGVTVDLAPSADLTLTPDDPIIGVRAFGSDPRRAAAHVAAYVSGMQSAGIAACAKHFPGHGASTVDSHHTLPVLPRTERQLWDTELVPFRAAVDAGVRSVMSGHLVVPDWGPTPATMNRHALTEVLRGQLGFTGAVITDALEMGAVANIADGAIQALLAGADLLCVGGELADSDVVDHLAEALVEAVRSGVLPEERLVSAASRARSLGGPVSPSGSWDPALGMRAARRALRVTGSPALTAPPLVIDVEVAPTIAAGPVPWGLGPHLAELLPGTEVVRSSGELPPVSSDRPVVVVTRDAHRHPEARDLVLGLVKIGLDLVHVETGVPGPDLGSAARIDTHGGSYVSLRAAAELLAARAAWEDSR